MCEIPEFAVDVEDGEGGDEADGDEAGGEGGGLVPHHRPPAHHTAPAVGSCNLLGAKLPIVPHTDNKIFTFNVKLPQLPPAQYLR